MKTWLVVTGYYDFVVIALDADHALQMARDIPDGHEKRDWECQEWDKAAVTEVDTTKPGVVYGHWK